MIRRITLLGCPPAPLRTFINFARRLMEAEHEQPDLRYALMAVEENCDDNRFTALIQACYPDGVLPGIYFGAIRLGCGNVISQLQAKRLRSI